MAKQVKQFRYYSDGHPKNWPKKVLKNDPEISYQTLKSGRIFTDCMPAYQVGIQAIPGTKFYINNANTPIIIGYTGIYELSLDKALPVVFLTFDQESLSLIKNNDNASLIVDLVYEDGVEN